MPESRTLHWEACPLCRSRERKELVDHGSIAFVRCSCGLVYKSRGESLFVEQTEPTWNKRYEKRRAERVRKSRWQLLDVLNHVEPGPVLDVGCSLGHALEAAADLGLEAKGLDLNAALVEPCRRLGYDIRVGDVAGPYPFPDASFNIVLLKHVFEHTPDPRAALAEVRRVLKPGGGLFIAVPNIRYYKTWLFRRSYYYFRPDSGGRYHFVYYKPKLLERLADEEGFRTVRVHPHLWHRGVSREDRLEDFKWWPYRAIDGRFRDGILLQREFWLTAVRER